LRGLDVGRYKAVDDTLAHSVEAYAGMPELFFTWIRRSDKRVHFEFLDNTVARGEPPRTAAFGWNDTLNVLDVECLLNVERFRKIDINAKAPAELYPDQAVLDPARNSAFLTRCLHEFREVTFADQASGRVYLRSVERRVAWIDEDAAPANARTLLRGVLQTSEWPAHSGRPVFLAAAERTHTVGTWG